MAAPVVNYPNYDEDAEIQDDFDYPDLCQYPGCQNASTTDHLGNQFDFCGMLHQRDFYIELLQKLQNNAAYNPAPGPFSSPQQLPQRAKMPLHPNVVSPAPSANPLPQNPPTTLPQVPQGFPALPTNPQSGIPALPANPPRGLPPLPHPKLPQTPQGSPGLPQLPQGIPRHPQSLLLQHPPGLPQLPQGLPQLPPALPAAPQGLPQLPPALPVAPRGLPQLPPALPAAPQGLPQLPPALPAAPPAQLPAQPQICVIASCTNAVYVDPNTGVASIACGKGHLAQARSLGLHPAPPSAPSSPAGAPSPQQVQIAKGICGKCRYHQSNYNKSTCQRCFWKALKVPSIWDDGGYDDPAIARLDPKSEEYLQMMNQFTKKWLHGHKKVGTVISVLQIHPKRALRDAFNARRDHIEALRNLEGRKRAGGGDAMSKGNLCLRFHGTSRTCGLGLTSERPCSAADCAVCRIIDTSWRLPKRIPGHFQRYGFGIYFTSTSSKSDDYNAKSEKMHNGSKTKCMFIARVLIGRGQEIAENDEDRTEPDQGYDSVLGKVDKSNAAALLNYDECVVYDVASCIPGYLVTYQVN